MSDKSFFKEQKEQSLVKARIVEKYFWAWSKVIISILKRNERAGNKLKLAYIDLFAGPGRYEDGSESTPLRVLETAIRETDLQPRLLTVFNDADSNNTQSLQKQIHAISEIAKLAHQPIIINQEVSEGIIEELKKIGDIPILFFVDPWGYKGLSLKLINSVLKNWGCDCIFFFNYNRINMGLQNNSVKTHMNALFGEQRADKLREKLRLLEPKERELTIVESICEALQEMGGEYVLPFCFKNDKGTRTSHHLIFVSKHVKGYEIMKEIMANESSEKEQGVASFEYNPATKDQPLLFNLARPLDKLEDMLLDDFAGQTIKMIDIYNHHHVGKRYIKKNYKSALRKLEEEGKITCCKPANQRPMRKGERTFADKVMVTFSPKPSN